MAISMEEKHFYEFGPFRVVPWERIVLRDGQPVPLPPKAFAILMALIQRDGHLVLKDDLMRTVWPETFVEEANLSQNIFLLRKALGENANEPHFIVTVSGRGYRFAGKVTEKEITGENDERGFLSGLPARSLPVKAITRRSHVAWAGLVLLLLLASTIYLARSLRRTRSTTAAPSGAPVLKTRRSVAILGFHNLSGDRREEWLSTALSEMLSTELAAGEHLRIVPSEEVARVRLDLPSADVDSLSKETLTKLRDSLGADLIVIGSYTLMGVKPNGRIRLDLRLQDAVAGETTSEIAVTGTENDLFDLVSRSGAQLRQRLGVEARSSTEAANVRASVPSNPEAARFYSRGLERLRLFDALTARDLLQEAVAADPDFPLSHSALASAWEALGYEVSAKEEGRRAVNLSDKLSREDRLLVEGDYREITKEWPKAVQNYHTLFALFPDDLEYGLRLGRAYIRSANSREAQAVLDTLRKLPPPASDDLRIDLADVDVASMQSDYKRALQAASRAVSKADTHGARLQLAEGRRSQGWVLMHLGEYAKALASLAEAKELFSAAGDRRHVAATLLYIADTMSDQGHYSSSLKLYREAMNYDRQTGCLPCMAPALNNMATVYESQRDFLAAGKLYEQALALFRENGERIKSTTALANVGEVHFYTGDLVGAETRYRQALDFFHEIGNTSGEASQLNNLAILNEAEGDLAGAKSRFEQALSLWRNNGQISESTAAMLGLGEVQLAQGDLAGARKTQEEAFAQRQKLGEKGSIAESQLALAVISLEEGRAADAEATVRAAAAEFNEEKVPDLEALAYAVLARALLDQDRFTEAHDAAKHATSMVVHSQEPMLKLSVAIADARVCAGDGHAIKSDTITQALHELEGVLREARRFGFVGLELEARLAAVEIAGGARGFATRHEESASLEQEALAKGYGLIARKVSAQGSPPS